MNQLFSISSNAKGVKGEKIGFLTGILYLAPADLSGYQVCPMALIAQCKAPCLNTAGLGGVYTSIQRSRIAKTRRFFEHRAEFMADVVYSIRKLIKAARKRPVRFKGRFTGKFYVPLVRLNGTSDIRWESIPVTIDGVRYANLMMAFPNIQFYDYSKLTNRRNLPANYDITFSYSGVPAYQKFVRKALDQNMRIAAVFRFERDIPARFLGRKVIAGDNSDVRSIEPRRALVALYAKGRAVADTSGFVVG